VNTGAPADVTIRQSGLGSSTSISTGNPQLGVVGERQHLHVFHRYKLITLAWMIKPAQ
jgi:hypothetical protein